MQFDLMNVQIHWAKYAIVALPFDDSNVKQILIPVLSKLDELTIDADRQ